MGGRGASSSTRLSKEEIRQRNREYLAKRMEQGREVLRQSMQRDLENIIQKHIHLIIEIIL